MAESQKVKGTDVVEKDLFKNATASAEKFLDVIIKTEKAIIDLNKETTKELSLVKNKETEVKKQNELLNKSQQQRKLIAEAKKLEAEATLAVTKAKAAEEAQEKKTNAEKLKAAKALEQQNSLYAQQSKRLNDLRKQYRDLALSENKSAEETKKLKTEINALDKQLKQVDADMGVFNRNVGDYKNQVKEALAETDLFSAGLGKLDNNTKAIVAGFGSVVEQLKKVRQAEDAATDGANKFGKTLKAAGITLLITAIASLFSFFTSSREGALEFDLALNKIKATLDVLVGSFAQVGKGLVSIGGALVDFFSGDFSDAQEKAAAGVDTISKAFDGNIELIGQQIEGYDRLTKEIFEYEDQLRLLQVALAKVKMDEEDFNEIQADTTISLNEQKAALEGGISARLEAARISKQIADTDLKLAKDQLEFELLNNKVSKEQVELLKQQGLENISASELSIKANNDTINSVQEKYLAQLAAADALDDLDRQEAERRRQIAQTEIVNEVELIRSKKLGADAQVQILTKQVADEKVQLEERERLNDQLRQKQIDAQNAEISALARLKTSKGEQAISEAELNDLIATTDAVVLAGKLKNLRATKLSEEAATEVAKVVKEAQDNEIANNERIAKFEEERTERLAKIKRLDQEIAIIQQQTQLQALGEVSADRAEKEQQAFDILFRNENVFNRNLISSARQASDARIAIAEEEARIKRELLDKQYEIDKQTIEKSVTDEQLKAKELEKLNAQYSQNIIKLNTETENTIGDLKKKKAEDDRKLLAAQTQIVVDNINKVSQAFSEALDSRFTQQSDQQQRQIDKTNANIAKQQDLAQRGQANQLAFEEARLAQQQLAQQDAAKKQAKIQEAIQTYQALLTAFNTELQQPGANPASAGARAIADVLLFKGLAKGIVQFAAEGNERVKPAQGMKSIPGKDSIPFMLMEDEGVVTADGNMGNPGVVKSLNNGTFKDLYMPKYETYTSKNTGDTAQNIATSIQLMKASNDEVVSMLNKIYSKPVHTFDVEGANQIIESVYKNGMKEVIKHQIKKPRI